MGPIRDNLRDLMAGASPELLARHAFGGLTSAQKESLAQRDWPVYTGKVRDVISCRAPGPSGDRELLIVHSDRLTAFDKLIAMVPYKGTILTEISAYWLERAKAVVPTHLLGRPHERVLHCRATTPIKVEVVVRGYLAGSMMRAYAQGERDFCGKRLPEGLKAYGSLPKAIITPTTKAAAFEHDEPVSAEDLITRGVCSEEDWSKIATMALALFEFGQKIYREVGWILVDTKYEFGRTADGQIIVIDEIHTPDSSRLWDGSTYPERMDQGLAPEMLDKETVRRWLIDHGFQGEGSVPAVPTKELIKLALVYLDVAERLTGRPVMTAGPDQMIDVNDLGREKKTL